MPDVLQPNSCVECERGNPVEVFPDGKRLHIHSGSATVCTIQPRKPHSADVQKVAATYTKLIKAARELNEARLAFRIAVAKLAGVPVEDINSWSTKECLRYVFLAELHSQYKAHE